MNCRVSTWLLHFNGHRLIAAKQEVVGASNTFSDWMACKHCVGSSLMLLQRLYVTLKWRRCVTSRRSCSLAMVTRAKNVTRVQELAFGHPSQDQGCPPTSTTHYSYSLTTIFLEFLRAANTLLSFLDNCSFQTTRQSRVICCFYEYKL